MKKEKVFLTGANGFLGRYVVEVFRENSINFTPSSVGDLNILNKEDVIKKTKGYKIIVHLAGNIRTSNTDTADSHFSINSVGTLNILEACRINKIPKIILASSTEVYGSSNRSGIISEADALIPDNFYGQSKLLAEHFCEEYSKKFGIKFIALRFTYLYGYGMYPSRIIPKIINASINGEKLEVVVNPMSFMDVLYVKDAARAVLLALRNKTNKGSFNISSSKKIKVNDIVSVVNHLFRKLNIVVKYKKMSEKSFIFNNKKALITLGFKPAYDLKNGIADHIKCSTL